MVDATESVSVQMSSSKKTKKTKSYPEEINSIVSDEEREVDAPWYDEVDFIPTDKAKNANGAISKRKEAKNKFDGQHGTEFDFFVSDEEKEPIQAVKTKTELSDLRQDIAQIVLRDEPEDKALPMRNNFSDEWEMFRKDRKFIVPKAYYVRERRRGKTIERVIQNYFLTLSENAAADKREQRSRKEKAKAVTAKRKKDFDFEELEARLKNASEKEILDLVKKNERLGSRRMAKRVARMQHAVQQAAIGTQFQQNRIARRERRKAKRLNISENEKYENVKSEALDLGNLSIKWDNVDEMFTDKDEWEAFTRKFKNQLFSVIETFKDVGKLAGNTSWNLIQEYQDDVMFFIEFLYSLYGETDPAKVFAITDLYLSRYCQGDRKKSIVISLVVALVNKCASSLTRQSEVMAESFIEESIENAKKASANLGNWYDSDAITTLRNVFLCALGLKLFPKEIAMTSFQWFGRPNAGTLFDLLRACFDGVVKLLEYGVLWFKGASVADLLARRDPIGQALIEGELLLNYRDALYTGLPVRGKMDAKQFVQEGNAVLTVLDSATKGISKMSPRINSILRTTMPLREAVMATQSRLISGSRATPIAVVIPGPPGIGKSKLIDLTAAIHSTVKGRKFHQSHVFHRDMSSDYWEGYDPFSQPYTHYSEVGSATTKIVASQGDQVLKELTSVIDSQPYSCNMAFEGKGKTFFLGECVIIDTNNEDMNIDYVVNNPAAYRRRFIYVRPTPKPQYRKDGSIALDFSKCNDGSRFFDKWTFDVYKKKPIDAIRSTDEVLLKGGSIDDLVDLLSILFSEHIMIEDSLANKVSDPSLFEGYGTKAKEFTRRQREALVNCVPFEDVKSECMFTPDCCHGHEACSAYSCLCDRGLHTPQCPRNELVKPIPVVVAQADHTLRDRIADHLKGISLFGSMTMKYCLWKTNALTLYVDKKFNRDSEKEKDWAFAVVCLFFILCMCFTPISFSTISLLTSILWCYLGLSAFVRHTFLQLGITKLKNAYEEDKEKLSRHYAREPEIVSTHKPVKIIFVAFLGAISSYLAYQGVKKLFKRKFIKGESEFKSETPQHDQIQAQEDSMHCGRSYVRLPGKVTSDWTNTMLKPNTLGKHSSDPKELYGALGSNIRAVKCEFSGGCSKTYLLGLKQDFAVINTHALGPKGHCKLYISKSGFFKPSDLVVEVDLREEDVWHLGSDVTVVRVIGVQFKDKMEHFLDQESLEGQYKAIIGCDPVVTTMASQSIKCTDKYVGEFYLKKAFEYSWKNAKAGMCGLPLIITINTSTVIAAIHSGSSAFLSFATMLNKRDLICAIEGLSKRTSLMNIYSEAERTFDTEFPNPKSVVFYENCSAFEYFGKLKGPVMLNNKSSLKITFYAPILDELFFEVFSFIPDKKYVQPLMQAAIRNGQYVSPINNSVRAMSHIGPSLNREVLNKVVEVLVDRIIKGLEKAGVEKLSPLTIDSALNGEPHDFYLRRMAGSTAAGFQRPGKKNDYMNSFEGSTYREPNTILANDMVEIYDCYKRGICRGPVYNAALKDEPRSQEKVAVGNTRHFFVGPFAETLIAKQMLAPFYTLMNEHSELFCTSIGIDMHRGADEMFNRMYLFSKYWMEGDFKDWDKTLPFDISLAANTVISRVLRRFGYNDEAMRIVEGILSDNLFSIINLHGDLLKISGIQPSGKYATAEDNSLKNLLIKMYFWYQGKYSHLYFFDYVMGNSYGDDLLDSMKEAVLDFYNGIVFQKFCKEQMGMVFTPTDKGGKMLATVDPFEATFLKRKFRKSKSLQRVVAYLEMSSLYKTLQWCLPSQSVPMEHQILSMTSSVLRELFFHTDDSKQFMKFRQKLLERFLNSTGFKSDGFVLQFFPTFDDLRNDLLDQKTHTHHVDIIDDKEEISLTVIGCEKSLQALPENQICVTEARHDSSVFLSTGIALYEEYLDRRQAVEKELADVEAALIEMKWDEPETSIWRLRRSAAYLSDIIYAARVERFAVLYSRRQSLYTEKNCIENFLKRLRQDVVSQSEFVGYQTKGPAKHMFKEGNMHDELGSEKKHSVVGKGTGADMYPVRDLTLDEFFRRPVEILTYNFLLNTRAKMTFNPWALLTGEPSIRAKFRNYTLCRATLHVRVVVSGTPFHYGKLQLAYIPFPIANDIATAVLTTPSSSVNYQGTITYYSQTTGSAVVDFGDNQPVDFEIPWIAPIPYFRLYADSSVALGSATVYPDLENAGTMIIQTINNPSSASSTATNVRMAVYAWLEDVHLDVPTATQIVITTESADERETGPVQKVATRAVEVMEAASMIPYIGPYARASAFFAKGVASLAALFGWSYPTLNENPTRVKNMPYANSAHLIGVDTGYRLTMDPKQELTIDPRIVGVEEDELAIASIVGREAYLDTFTWSSADQPFVSLWSAKVSPRAGLSFSPVGKTIVFPTPMAWVGALFSHWRGEIEYRIEVACSKFHRGKFAVIWEPNVSQRSIINASLSLNKQYIKLIDIQDCQECVFTVPWARERQWIPNFTRAQSITSIGTQFQNGSGNLACNGYITIFPITPLQSPEEAPIFINIYVNGEHVQFNYPISTELGQDRVYAESDHGDEPEYAVNKSGSLQHHFGEMPLSLRSLLKRFGRTSQQTSINLAGTTRTFTLTRPVYPASPNITSAQDPTLFGYVRAAFMGMRGEIRKRWRFPGFSLFISEAVRVSLRGPEIAEISTSSTANNMASDPVFSGSVTFIPHTNAGVEFGIPHYSTNLWVAAFRNAGLTFSPQCDDNILRNYNVAVETTGATTAGIAYEESATGEDFSFLRFIAAPYYSF